MIEPATLAELWRTHASRLLVIARSIGEPAEDAVREAFTSLAMQRRIPDDPLAWLVRCARNWLVSTQRKRKTKANYLEAIKTQDIWFCDPVADVDSKLDAKQVTEWLRGLPHDERQVIAMHLWGGMTFRQIAIAMQCSPATANRLYHGGLVTLRKKANLAEEYCHEK